MSNHDLTGMNHHFDPHGFIGTICTLITMIFGFLTVNEYAILIGMGVGITTIGLNIMKMVNERKRGQLIDKEFDDDDDDDEPE